MKPPTSEVYQYYMVRYSIEYYRIWNNLSPDALIVGWLLAPRLNCRKNISLLDSLRPSQAHTCSFYHGPVQQDSSKVQREEEIHRQVSYFSHRPLQLSILIRGAGQNPKAFAYANPGKLQKQATRSHDVCILPPHGVLVAHVDSRETIGQRKAAPCADG